VGELRTRDHEQQGLVDGDHTELFGRDGAEDGVDRARVCARRHRDPLVVVDQPVGVQTK
jgi:hypothetical protein